MRKYTYIVVGLLLGALLTYFVMKQFQTSSTTNDSQIIAYEIKKLNKMIVAEQMVSNVVTHKSSRYIPGLDDIFSLDKKLVLVVNAKVQATYDMSQMRVRIDSVNQAIYIQKIPDLDIKTYPDVQFFDVEQSVFNSFDANELNSVKKDAAKLVEDKIDYPKLEKEAHAQLINNLGEVYLLAKIYNWKIIDNTPYAKELELKYN
ncbi:MAG: DUF4230 domain-containing protein [Moheibacter sp.]